MPEPSPLPSRFVWSRVWKQAVILAVLMFSSLGCYLIVLKWTGHNPKFITWTPVDEWIPFQPAWVWVYMLPYAIAPISIGYLTEVTFWWFVRRALVTVFITMIVFIFVPTQTGPRPPHTLSPGITSFIYEEMVKIDDPPANAAPSLHVSLTTLVALAMLRDFPRYWFLSLGSVALVWLSTLFTRQHHLIDVGTGAGLAVGVALFMDWLARKQGLRLPRSLPEQTQEQT